ncbi:hypothetical protein GCM10010458_36500 [Microbacterium luteolum]|uniref:Uncharacterized protein n=1 Tax=Microbacterium luteolum TaxID=69367 RepID=A0ABY7XNX1_MICLT|nr:hypothetical protein [Microbacterium luteolum]WDM42515.1 hypothetical protein KV395_04180 [Microbacterium luteolum]
MAINDDEIVTPAYAQYFDFAGTVAADTHGGGTRELADQIGLDAERFWIVGIDVWGNDIAHARLKVLAIDRVETGISTYDELAAYNREHGHVPVTDFLVHGMSAVDVLKVGLKRLNFQLLSRSLPDDAELRMTRHGDLNYDGD